MKKVFALLIGLCLLLPCITGLADEEKKEIVFRGIPWGTSATDFLAKMKDDGLGGTVRLASTVYSWEKGEGRDTEDSLVTLSDAGYYYYTYDDTVVAGIPVDVIYAYFLYTFDADNLYTKENESNFYYAYYSFNPVDIESAAPILEEKLNGLYGNGQKKSDSVDVINLGGNNYVKYMDTVTWYGANDTALRMYVEHRYDKVTKTTEYTDLRLYYGKSNSINMINAVKDAMVKDEIKRMQNNDSTDGL